MSEAHIHPKSMTSPSDMNACRIIQKSSSSPWRSQDVESIIPSKSSRIIPKPLYTCFLCVSTLKSSQGLFIHLKRQHLDKITRQEMSSIMGLLVIQDLLNFFSKTQNGFVYRVKPLEQPLDIVCVARNWIF